MSYRDADTPVGIVTAASRENEVIRLTALESMLEEDINMQSTGYYRELNNFFMEWLYDNASRIQG